MTALELARVVGENGLSGMIEAKIKIGPDGQPGYLVRFDDGRQVVILERMMALQDDGSYYLPMDRAQLESYSGPDGALTVVVPLVAEELRIGKRRFETGGVRVSTHVKVREKVVEEPGFREILEVERVPANREITGPVSIRQEGDTTIVPLVEEVLVTEKRLVLREEIRITKRREEVTKPQRVTVRRQEATIERVAPGQGKT